MSRVLTATQNEWARRVRAWLASGMDRIAFAEREGLPAKQLGWWRWKLCEMGVALDANASNALPQFVEVTLQPPRSSLPIEVVMTNGVIVRVPVGFDEMTLARTLTVLEASRR